MHPQAMPESVAGRHGLLELVESCFPGDLDAAIELLVERATMREGGYVCMCNVHVLTEALRDTRLHDVLRSAAIRFPDGEPVAWLLRRVGSPRARRIGGPDLFPGVVDRGRVAELRHFLVGTTDANLARLEDALVDSYPGVDVVGKYAPPYGD